MAIESPYRCTIIRLARISHHFFVNLIQLNPITYYYFITMAHLPYFQHIPHLGDPTSDRQVQQFFFEEKKEKEKCHQIFFFFRSYHSIPFFLLAHSIYISNSKIRKAIVILLEDSRVFPGRA